MSDLEKLYGELVDEAIHAGLDPEISYYIGVWQVKLTDFHFCYGKTQVEAIERALHWIRGDE